MERKREREREREREGGNERIRGRIIFTIGSIILDPCRFSSLSTSKINGACLA